MRDAEQFEEARRDLAGQDVLGGIAAAEAAPGDEQERRKSVHERQGRKRVEACAEAGVLHDHRGPAAAEPGAGGEPDGDVLAHRRNPGSGPITLERDDEGLDQRAGNARVEVEAVAVEKRGELGPRQDRRAHRCEVRFSSWMNSSCLLFIFFTSSWYRSEEHTSELQSLRHLVCRLLLE